MADGGVWDHVGGGFHRYSVDEYWHVPHFEKMLYDNPQLADTYLAAFQLSGDARYAATARGILDYLRRDMTHPQGGIFSAEVCLLFPLAFLVPALIKPCLSLLCTVGSFWHPAQADCTTRADRKH